MNTNRQILNAVANIQDELTRITAVAGLMDAKLEGNFEEFQKKIVSEFNTKLRGVKSKNRVLRDENKALKARVLSLEAKLSGQTAAAAPFKSSASMAPPIKRSHEEKVVILSSPIKGATADYKEEEQSPVKPGSAQKSRSNQFLLESEPSKSGVTSSQFNGLPTQYSDSSSQSHGFAVLDRREERDVFVDISPPKKKTKSTEKVIGNFAGDECIVADSQDELEPLVGSHHGSSGPESVPKYPSHYTALQRVEFLRLYYQSKKADMKFNIDLRKNPITEKIWALDDFIPNPKWKPTAKVNTNLGTMTKRQEKSYRDFFNEAGLGKKVAGPIWDSDERDNEEDLSWHRSQVMDKYSSPPGYMTGDFVGTQEAAEQKREAKLKQQDRIRRRFQSVLASGEFMFYEDILNFFVQEKRYVNLPPAFSKV